MSRVDQPPGHVLAPVAPRFWNEADQDRSNHICFEERLGAPRCHGFRRRTAAFEPISQEDSLEIECRSSSRSSRFVVKLMRFVLFFYRPGGSSSGADRFGLAGISASRALRRALFRSTTAASAVCAWRSTPKGSRRAWRVQRKGAFNGASRLVGELPDAPCGAQVGARKTAGRWPVLSVWSRFRPVSAWNSSISRARTWFRSSSSSF